MNIFALQTLYEHFMMKKFFWGSFLLLFCMMSVLPVRAEALQGRLGNLVCFVRFLDEEDTDAFEHSYSWYDRLFNDVEEDANSVFNYFRKASYGRLLWTSGFYPSPSEDKIVSYRVSHERGYYREKGEINTIGYVDELDKAAREQALVREIAAGLSVELPDDMVLDANEDGVIDNFCIVLSGRSELGSRHLLWPHRSDLALPEEKAIYIKGKRLVGYLMVFDDANGWASLEPIELNTGVVCHEMSHSLGTYDLYHANGNLNPVGVWDLMSDNLTTPQHMSAYTKYRYCGWLDKIPEITEPGTYMLNPVGGAASENIVYAIKPVGSDEYFMVEYRRKDGVFDSGLPESGLLVYRINPAYTGGNVNYNGTTRLDEMYVFRPGGTTKLDGDISKAAFSAESGRTAFGGDADVKPFYSDGSVARFALTHISSCGETISFDYVKLGNRISLSEDATVFMGTSGNKMELAVEADVDWVVGDVPEWLSLTPSSGEAGKTTVVVETLSENTTAQERKAELSFTSSSDTGLKTIFTVRQQSNIVLPPSGLSAQIVGNGTVELKWTAPKEGAPILSDGFEDILNPNGWMIDNAPGDRGWTWMETSRIYTAYAGNYSMYMKSAWEDLHQNERLISPVFSNGRTLSFQSKSIAPGKTVRNQYYYVEVSCDGGKTWNVVYDLMNDCEVVNQYVKINIDLSEYQSEQMQVSFHAYDETDLGLSYWWQIDDVEVWGLSGESVVNGYAVYRNGVKIGEVADNVFVDDKPLSGENLYTVRAVGGFGESSDSAPFILLYDPTGTSVVEAARDIVVAVEADGIMVRSDVPLRSVRLLTASGLPVALACPKGNDCVIDCPSGHGLYFVVCETEGTSAPVVRKVLLK